MKALFKRKFKDVINFLAQNVKHGTFTLLLLGAGLCLYALAPAWGVIETFITCIIILVPFFVDLCVWLASYVTYDEEGNALYYAYRIPVGFVQLLTVVFANPFESSSTLSLALFILGWTTMLAARLFAILGNEGWEK